MSDEDAAALRLFEQLMAQALLADDPPEALRALRLDARLPEALRAPLDAVDEDGLRLSALLVAKLRFERLMRGCLDAEVWFERDPGGFADAFRAFHREVPPTAFSPPEEARLFLDWCVRQEPTS